MRYNGANLNLSHTSIECDDLGECDAMQFLNYTKNYVLKTSSSDACLNFKRPTLIDMTSWLLLGLISLLLIGVFIVLMIACLKKKKQKEQDPTERFRFMKE